jgi:hypothetical protein
LPKSFENSVAGGTEDTYTDREAINPKAFKGTSIRPDQFAKAALNVFVVHYRRVVISIIHIHLVETVLALLPEVWLIIRILAVQLHEAHLAEVPHLPQI